MQWQSLTLKVFLLLGLSTSLTDARLILTPVTSPWIKTAPWKTTHPSQNARVDLISKPTAQGGLFSPRTGDKPWKPSRLTSTTDFQEKLGPDAYPLSQGSAISGFFFLCRYFPPERFIFPSRAPSFPMIIQIKNREGLTVQLPSCPGTSCTTTAAYSYPPHPRHY